MKRVKILSLVHEHLVPPVDTTGIDVTEAEWKMEYDVIETLREIGHDVRVLGTHDDLAGIRTVTEESAAQGQQALWQLYDNIKAATLITRGAESDLLSKDTALAMTQRGPKAQLVEFEGVGHAPTFVTENQVEVVTSFLLGPEHEKPDRGAR